MSGIEDISFAKVDSSALLLSSFFRVFVDSFPGKIKRCTVKAYAELITHLVNSAL